MFRHYLKTEELASLNVTYVMSNYITSFFDLPFKVTNKLTNHRSKFWCGKNTDKFCRLLAWNRICLPKSEGGQGLKSLKDINLSLPTKIAWRIITSPSSLLSNIMIAKYERNKG